jgi:hypothetical protein
MAYTKTVFVEPGDKRSRQVIRKETRENYPGAKVRILRVERIVPVITKDGM